MSGPFKLTKDEGLALIGGLEGMVGTEKIAAVLLVAVGPERTARLVVDRQAVPMTRSEKIALINGVVPLIPGDTPREKVRNVGRAAKPAFATKARFLEAVEYVKARIKRHAAESAGSSAYPASGPVTGYGPVNNHWKLPDDVVRRILDRMQLKNVRVYKTESVGHAKEDVLGTPAKLEQCKRAILFAKAECARRGIIYSPTNLNDNAGKSTWNNSGPALSDRLPQAKAFLDWFAANVDPVGTEVVIVGETRTSAGKELEKYGAKVLKAAGFRIGNNNGSRPQATTVFGGVQTDFFEYHPTSTGDWPKSKAAHVVSDTGAILAQLNQGGNVYGLGNPAAIAAWRAAGVAAGYAFVVYYGFDAAEYDEASIDAMSPGPTASASAQPVIEGDVDLSSAKWIGAPNAARAKVLSGSLADLTIDATHVRYSIAKATDSWEPHRGKKKTNQCACFFVRRNGQLVGGRFDDSSWSRKDRELKNIRSGYTGGIVPTKGEDVWFCFTDVGGTVRTNCQKVTWP